MLTSYLPILVNTTKVVNNKFFEQSNMKTDITGF